MTAAEGLALAASRPFDAILLDVNLPDMYGVTALRRLRALGLEIPIFVITGCYFESEVEAEARAAGATDFVRKPVFEVEQLADALKSAAAATPPAEHPQADAEFGIIAASAAMRDVRAWVKRVAPGEMSVLLTGETGTGKEVVARAVHVASGRPGRFVAVNGGAIPEALFESELFGHVRGAFTSADRAKPGLVEEAHGGTLFLDEIGEMPLPQQVRLLRFLDQGECRRVGETRDRTVDARIIAATNRDVREQVARGRFREDLYFRLAAATYTIPALRERPDDIEPLTHFCLEHLRQDDGRAVSASQPALDALRAHRWPGNVRELRSVLERARSMATGPLLTARDVSLALGRAAVEVEASSGTAHKHRRAQAALLANRFNATQAARSLGIGRATFYRWLRVQDESEWSGPS